MSATADVGGAAPGRAGGPWPRWVWPALAGVLVVAAASTTWGASHQGLELYYQAAVRSMGSSWHDFLYGALDPRGTITVDKLPGALWVQALSVRAFGYHPWALVLPQAVEGVLAVAVLFRGVARTAGPVAGLVAAGVLATTPVTVALGRGNISDSLLILLLVLAADALVTALRTDHARWLVLAGGWVGLAFQAKMLQAWFVLPCLVLAWLVGSRLPMARRIGAAAGAVAVAVVVSLSWMTAVSVVPRSHRPAVDGSAHGSEFEQVFVYNGFTRVGEGDAVSGSGSGSASNGAATSTFSSLTGFRLPAGPGAGRLLLGAGGRAVAWLLPASVVGGLAVLWERRRRWSGDRLVATTVFWGGWLGVHLVAFSFSSAGINAYYAAALGPPIAALAAISVVSYAPRARTERPVAVGLAATALATVAYGAWLARPGPALVEGLAAVAALVAVAGAVVLLRPASSPGTGPVPPDGPTGAGGAGTSQAHRSAWRPATFAAVALVGAMAVLPAVASADVVHEQLGPFDTPFEPASTRQETQGVGLAALASLHQAVALMEQANGKDRYVAGVDSGIIAAPLIVDSGVEFEPLGGFLGSDRTPSLATIQRQIRTGQVHLFIVTQSPDPRYAWIRNHCTEVRATKASAPAVVLPGIQIDFCLPATAGG